MVKKQLVEGPIVSKFRKRPDWPVRDGIVFYILDGDQLAPLMHGEISLTQQANDSGNSRSPG